MGLQESSDVLMKREETLPAGPDPWTGHSLGRYRIIRPLGKGGMGVVYEARDAVGGRAVALKMLAEQLAGDPGTLRRFLREASAASRLNHPNLVRILDVAHQESIHFIVMELIGGGSALQILRRRGFLEWDLATRIVADVCRGLGAAHKAGLIHRDIKPGNILLTGEGKAKLGDFGLVKISHRTGSTGSGDLVGTPNYMSPEQCKSEELDVRSDVYSLGATYYALLTGRPPFEEENPLQVMFAHCARPVPDPRRLRPEIPDRCLEVLLRALAKHRCERHGSAEAMLADLEGILTGPVKEPPSPASGQGSSFPTAPAMKQNWNHLGRGSRKARIGPTGLVLPAGGGVQAVAFSPDGKRIAAGLHEGPGGVEVWDIPAAEWSFALSAGNDGPVGIRCLAFAPDGKHLAAGCRDGLGVCLWDLEKGSEDRLTVKGRKIRALAFSPDGQMLAAGLGTLVGNEEAFLCLWQADDGWQTPSFCPPHEQVNALAFSHSGQSLFLAGNGENSSPEGSRIWEWTTASRELVSRPALDMEIYSLAVSPGGQEVVLAGSCRNIPVLQFLNQGSGKRELVEAGRRTGCFTCVGFSPDGRLLAAGCGQEVVLWDPRGRKTLVSLIGHKATVQGLAFSPDGKTLATGSWDRTVRLWNIVPYYPEAAREGGPGLI